MKTFFVGDVTDLDVAAFGSSVTEPVTSFAYLVRNWMSQNYLYKSVTALTSQAKSGHWAFSNNIRYPAELGTAVYDIYLTDYRITNIGRDDKALEALTRRIFTDNPNAVIISPIIPEDGDLDGAVDDLDTEALTEQALADHYGVHLVDYRQEVIDRVAGGELLSTYIADSIHPTQAGHALAASMIEAAIVANGWLTPEDHSTLPARLYDDGGYGRDPIRVNGNANDAETGTGWSDVGTNGRESSTAGDTITFSATCQQFGLYNSGDGYAQPLVDVRIDGGSWQTNQTATHNGYYGGSLEYGAHTLEFRVVAGNTIRIDEFWAI